MANEAQKFGLEISNPIWRLSRTRYAAFELPPLRSQGNGRFDDPSLVDEPDLASFGVLYCGETAYSSFVEMLSGLRNSLQSWSDIHQQIMMEVEMRDSLNLEADSVGSVISREWREDWNLTSANVVPAAPVFDLASGAAVQFIREQLAVAILAFGLDDLDFGELLGSNRTLTQAISRWIWSMSNESGVPLFSGIRYRSRFDPECICLALYQDRFEVLGEIDIQPITPETPGFAEAASILRLKIS